MFEIRCENCQAEVEPCIDCVECQKYLQCKNCQDKENKWYKEYKDRINCYCIDCLKYNHENGFKLCTSKLISNKYKGSFNTTYKHIKKFRYPISRDKTNYLEIMKYANENGYPLNIFHFCDSYTSRNNDGTYDDECICFGIVHENNICPYKDYFFPDRGAMNDPYKYEDCEYDDTCNYIECIKYALENSYIDTKKETYLYDNGDISTVDNDDDDDDNIDIVRFNDIMKTCVCINGKYIYKYEFFLPPDEKYYHTDDIPYIFPSIYPFTELPPRPSYNFPLIKTYEDIIKKDNGEPYNIIMDYDKKCYNLDDTDFFVRVIHDRYMRKRIINQLNGINNDAEGNSDDESDEN
jgi:hypothetical protein